MIKVNLIKGLLITVLVIISTNIYSQNKYPKDYFRSPIDFRIQIAGNFGEIRNNHFHTGLDILTEGQIGKNIYAIADGYVSRINISAGGYGNAIYITHPNGYVSVYAHLKSFKKEITDYLDSAQHSKHLFELNLYPLPEKFPVKKGEIIALSGNSGRSSGPHLHFEIRERDSEEPVNPFLFGIDVKDNVSPRIFSVRQYNFPDTINWDSFTRKTYTNINGKTIKVNGNVGFGIELFDYTTGRHNTNGIYNLILKVDDTIYFESKFDKLSFYTNRYINSYIDYRERISTRKKITKCFVEPNNRLANYLVKKDNGIYNFNDGKLHKVEILAKDFYGNYKRVSFKVQSGTSYLKKKNHNSKYVVQNLFYQKINYFDNDEIKLTFHRNSLLYNIGFQYYTSVPKFKAYSKIHHLHKASTALFNKFSIAIKVDSLDESLKEKVLIARISKQGRFIPEGGKYIDGYVISKTNYFGNYVVLVDTILPRIRLINKSKTKLRNLKFRISDNLSGIKTYNGYIDGKWVLFKYDVKYHLINCDLSNENIKKGKHELLLEVSDYSGNVARFKKDFVY